MICLCVSYSLFCVLATVCLCVSHWRHVSMYDLSVLVTDVGGVSPM